jgi:hypothetical protein
VKYLVGLSVLTLLVLSSRVSGSSGYLMVPGGINGSLGVNTTESGGQDICMGKAALSGLMETNMTGNGRYVVRCPPDLSQQLLLWFILSS